MKKYFCKKFNQNIYDKYFCVECKDYEPLNKNIKVNNNITYDKLVFLKMISCVNSGKYITSEPTHIKLKIDKFINKNFDTKEINEKRLLIYWNDLVGDFIASKTRITRIYHSVIYVKAINKAFANDLIYLKETLLEKINQNLKNCNFKSIKIV